MNTNQEERLQFNLHHIDTLKQFVTKKGVSFNLDNPTTIQEKLMWLNIYDTNPLKTECADKLLVKEYVKKVLGRDISVPTLAVWDSADEIDFSNLPDQFVLKCNHGSGMNVIVKDKSKVNIQDVRNKFRKWLSEDFAFSCGFESHYHWIDRKVFAEKFMNIDDSEDISDYKFLCFNGQSKLMQIVSDRNGNNRRLNYYDISDLQKLSLERTDFPADYSLDDILPTQIEQMKTICQKLSKDFKFVRIDLYEVNGQVYLGEMTFTPGAFIFRYKDPKDEIRIGNMLNLGIPEQSPSSRTNEQFIISLTSHPGRINYVRKALDSLINQECAVPFKIVLVLAEPQFPGRVIPYQITELEWDKKIEILWHPTDIRSHKKLNPTLQKYPDATIIVTDDDVIRPTWWLQMFIDDHSLFLYDVIVGLSAWRLQRNYQQTSATDFKSPKFKLKCVIQPHKILYTERPANGLGGVLYPKHTFNDVRFFNEELFMDLSPYSDESWQYCFNVIEEKTLRMCSNPIDWLDDQYAIKECSETGLCIHNTQKEYTRLYNLLMDEFPEYKQNMIERFDLYDNIKNPVVQKSKEQSQDTNTIKSIHSENSQIHVIGNNAPTSNNKAEENNKTVKAPEIKKDVKPCVVCRLTGRLGNIVFQIASARYYAKQHGNMSVKFYYPKEFKTDIKYFESSSLNKILKEPVVLTTKEEAFSNGLPVLEANEESSIIYTEISYMKDYNIHIIGNRQSEKYFSKQFVMDMFDFSKIDKEIDRMYKELGDLSQIAALHIRRTDYVYPKRHYQTIEEQDVIKIREKFQNDKFIIFSDDIEWCKIKFEKYGFLFPPKNDSEFDDSIIEFCALRKFMAIIMSNSTFSWWGSYLSTRPNHWTVYKEPWFTYTTKQDIIPNDKNWFSLEKFLEMT